VWRVTPAPGIRFAGACRVGAEPLFGPIDLRIVAGGWTCLLGPSGIGKSTVLRLIAGLDTGCSFNGDIATDDGEPLAGRVSYMAQSDLLAPWLDVLGNVTLGMRLRVEAPDLPRARRLIERVGLSAHVHKKPRVLSGGMRQRAALARTLMEDRPIALLDEPFSALDARTRAEMQELSAELLGGRTVLLVTHDPGEAARLGNRIVLWTEAGLTEMQAPASAPVRLAEAPETLACQADLLQALRGSGA